MSEMSQPSHQESWITFYENSIPILFKELGRVPSFEEFQEIVFANDFDLGEE